MKQLQRVILTLLLFTIFSFYQVYAGTTGKIAGTVIDKATNEPLIGATVAVVGTKYGAITDVDGKFTILEVPPGTYNIQISYIGYRTLIVDNVRVFIDQTARIDVGVESQAVQVGEMVIVAQRKVIKPDVATSVVAVSDKEIQELPVTSVNGVVNLQAGIRDGSIRGGGSDKILFMVDGVTLRDPRNNQSTSQVALSAVKEISIERGGFNAEYGQVRSGIVNVVTREGSKSDYAGRFQFRLSPAAPKYYRGDGILDVTDPMSYALRPFFDNDVCWTGTGNGKWDEYTRRQYPEFMGWNEISRILNTDNDPNNDLTPLGAQRVFEYETRKKQLNNEPDFDIDAGFGGPVPFVSEMLGGLRFYTSYRSTRDMLLFPLTRPDYRDYDWTLQLNSDIAENMRLRASVLYGEQFTMRHNWDGTGIYYYPRYPSDIANVASSITGPADLIGLFSDFNFALADIGHRSLASKFTHTISSKTFYEISVENFRVNYNVRPSALRDTTKLFEIIPGFYEDSNPFGYWPGNSNGVIITGGQHVAKARDFSVVNSSTIKADFTSQVNNQNLLKAGVEFNYNNLDFDYGTIASATQGKTYATRVQMQVFPIRAAAYLQDKLETDEFILNVGLRLDYSNSNDNWWAIDPFNASFYSTKYNDSKIFDMSKSEPQWQLSPRLGIAHPISENAKLFFNYGHFKQSPQYESMFRVQRNQQNGMSSIGNPNLILAKTISYELGFDYSINDDILLQLAAYYNDISNQQDYTTYFSTAAGFSYSMTSANNYEDIRGFEFTIRKTRGTWWSGFANYTYQVNTSGHFGSANQYDNVSDQKKYDEATVNLYQNRPIPQPYARLNLNFFTPSDFGPELLGHHVLGGWMLNVLMDWQSGGWATYNPKNLPYVSANVQSVDYFNTNLRIDKTINTGKFSFNLFMDVSNLFNTLRLWNTGDQDYRTSLHLPKSNAYDNIPGEDKIGDYRKPGVDFQPMEYQAVIDQSKTGKSRVIYYEGASGNYFEYTGGKWAQVDQGRINRINEERAYIDMPNASTFWFLDPRKIYFGIRVSFNFTD